MFNIDLFTKLVKSKYTNTIQLTRSNRVSNIIEKDNGFYHLTKIYDLIDLPVLSIITRSNAEDSQHLLDFEKLLVADDKDFKWFYCWYNNGGIAFEVVMICSNEKEDKLYNNLLRFENLKVFV